VFYAIVKDQDLAYVNTSAATTRTLLFRKPNGTVLTKTASQVASYTGTNADVAAGVTANAVMQYTTIAGDLDVAGLWAVQGIVGIGSGLWHTDERIYQVHPNLA
jgi:hypothetical protein